MSSTYVHTSEAPTPGPAKRWKHLLKRTVQTLAGAIILLACVGVAYEFIEEGIDARRFPRRGRLVQLGPEFQNVRLNLDCSGRDPSAGLAGQNALPTVILD